MNFAGIRTKMEHNAVGRSAIRVLRGIGAVHVLHTVKAGKARKKFMNQKNSFAKFYDINKAEFDRVYDILEDEISRKTYKAIIDFRQTYDIKLLNRVYEKKQYFLKEILPPKENEVFIDGGAYIGDTALDFLKNYQEGSSYKMYLWEPDKRNAEQICKLLGRAKNYKIIPLAMWNGKDSLSFSADGAGTSAVGINGSAVDADSIDNLHSDEQVTFIKMDIEGAEIEALKGAEKTIKRCKPKLAICIYHEYEHLYKIPMMIKEMVPEYKLYMRHHSDTSSETVIYACVEGM